MENQRPPRSSTNMRGRPPFMRPPMGSRPPFYPTNRPPFTYPNSAYNNSPDEEETRKLKEMALKRLQESENNQKVIAISDAPGSKAVAFTDGPPKAITSKTVKIESKPVTISSTPSKAILIESAPKSEPKITSKESLKEQQPETKLFQNKSSNQQSKNSGTNLKQIDIKDHERVKSSPPAPQVRNWANIASQPSFRSQDKPSNVVRSVEKSSVNEKKPVEQPKLQVKKDTGSEPGKNVQNVTSQKSDRAKPTIPSQTQNLPKSDLKKDTIESTKKFISEPTKIPSVSSPNDKKYIELAPKSPLKVKGLEKVDSPISSPKSPKSPKPLKPQESWRSAATEKGPDTWRKPDLDADGDDEDGEEDPDNLLSEEMVEFIGNWNDKEIKLERPFDIKLIYTISYLSKMKDNEAPPPYVNPELHYQLFTNQNLKKKTKQFKKVRRGGKRKLAEVDLIVMELGLKGDLRKAEKKWAPPKISTDDITGLSSKLTGLFNKLTKENYDGVSSQICDSICENVSDEKIGCFVNIIFQKAIIEQHFVQIYADCCKSLFDKLSQKDQKLSKKLFEKLAQTCQSNFESRPKWSELQKKIEDAGKTQGQDISEEEMNVIYMKKRALGNIQFVGALFSVGIISGKIIFTILIISMKDNIEDDIELAISLINSCGVYMESFVQSNLDKDFRVRYSQIFGRLKDVSQNKAISSRVRFMCMDILDQKRKGFEVSGPKKLKDVHRESEDKRRSERPTSARGGSFSGNRQSEFRRSKRGSQRDERPSYGKDDNSFRKNIYKSESRSSRFSPASSPVSQNRKEFNSRSPLPFRDNPQTKDFKDNKDKPTKEFKEAKQSIPEQSSKSVDVADIKKKFDSNFVLFSKSNSSVDLLEFLNEISPSEKEILVSEWCWKSIESLPSNIEDLYKPFAKAFENVPNLKTVVNNWYILLI
eukprot:NODE_128_length_17019_cov_0.764480.p1 type:complete len:930 gc:universal NODE_128_length_17019_cov_0.764480:9526-12315(+)